MNDLQWQRVEAALDARRDPLEDPDIAAALSRDPQSLAAVQRLMGRLEVLPTLLERNPGGRSLRRVPALAAGVLALLTASLLMIGEPSIDAPGAALASAWPTSTDTLATTVSLTIETTTLRPRRRPQPAPEPRRIVTWNLEKRQR